MHFIGVHLRDTFESLRNHARTHLISPPYVREHVFRRARVCLWKRGEKEKRKRRRTRRRKKMSISGALWGLTCPRYTWHSYGTKVCTRAQLANDWAFRGTYELSFLLDGWEEETWRGKPVPLEYREGAEAMTRARERERETGRKKETRREIACVGGKRRMARAVVTRCNYALLWHLRSYIHTYPFFLFFYFWRGFFIVP